MSDYAMFRTTRGGEPRYSYSRWGSPHIPWALLTGPEGSLLWIEEQEPTTHYWGNCQGFIHLDLDQQRLEWFSTEIIRKSPEARFVFEKILEPLWSGWKMDYVPEGLDVFARWMGEKDADSSNPIWGSWDDTKAANIDLSYRSSHPWRDTVISWRDDSGVIHDLCQPGSIIQYLKKGPKLLAQLKSPKHSKIPESPDTGAWIDIKSKTLVCGDTEYIRKTDLKKVAQLWPGWNVQGQVSGLAGQFALSGRPRTLSAEQIAEHVAFIAKELLRVSKSLLIDHRKIDDEKTIYTELLSRALSTAVVEIPAKMVSL